MPKLPDSVRRAIYFIFRIPSPKDPQSFEVASQAHHTSGEPPQLAKVTPLKSTDPFQVKSILEAMDAKPVTPAFKSDLILNQVKLGDIPRPPISPNAASQNPRLKF